MNNDSILCSYPLQVLFMDAHHIGHKGFLCRIKHRLRQIRHIHVLPFQRSEHLNKSLHQH